MLQQFVFDCTHEKGTGSIQDGRRRTLAGAQNIYINTGSACILLVWPSILELSTDGTSTPGLDSRRLQAAVEDSFIFVDVGLL